MTSYACMRNTCKCLNFKLPSPYYSQLGPTHTRFNGVSSYLPIAERNQARNYNNNLESSSPARGILTGKRHLHVICKSNPEINRNWLTSVFLDDDELHVHVYVQVPNHT